MTYTGRTEIVTTILTLVRTFISELKKTYTSARVKLEFKCLETK